MKNVNFLTAILAASYISAFEGDPAPTDPKPGDPAPTDPKPGDPAPEKTFTQAQVDGMMQKHRTGLQETVTNLQGQLVALQSSATATQDEKDTLANTINTLETQMMSQKEISERDKKRADSERETAVATANGERDAWRNRFESTLAVNALTQAAIDHKAFDPSQIVNMHQGQVTITEVLKEGVGTGKFESRMKLSSTNEKGETVELDLSVPDAVKELATRESYANLFNFDGKHGMQRRNEAGIKTNLDRKSAASDMKSYRENRDALMS